MFIDFSWTALRMDEDILACVFWLHFCLTLLDPQGEGLLVTMPISLIRFTIFRIIGHEGWGPPEKYSWYNRCGAFAISQYSVVENIVVITSSYNPWGLKVVSAAGMTCYIYLYNFEIFAIRISNERWAKLIYDSYYGEILLAYEILMLCNAIKALKRKKMFW